MEPVVLLDAAGRRQSAATMPPVCANRSTLLLVKDSDRSALLPKALHALPPEHKSGCAASCAAASVVRLVKR
jgi:hypothetical protein